jgi:hypothetical protein
MREKRLHRRHKRQHGTSKSLHGQQRYYGQQTDSIDNKDASKDTMDNTVPVKTRSRDRKHIQHRTRRDSTKKKP